MTWKKTILIDWSGETFEERRDATVAALRASGWLRTASGEETLEGLIAELEETTDADDFDYYWDLVYDEADYDRVWLKVIY